jgi:sensor histidine kinase YesM
MIFLNLVHQLFETHFGKVSRFLAEITLFPQGWTLPPVFVPSISASQALSFVSAFSFGFFLWVFVLSVVFEWFSLCHFIYLLFLPVVFVHSLVHGFGVFSLLCFLQ